MAVPEIELWGGAVADQWVWGTEVLQWGPGAEPLLGGVRGQSPPKTGVWEQRPQKLSGFFLCGGSAALIFYT